MTTKLIARTDYQSTKKTKKGMEERALERVLEREWKKKGEKYITIFRT